MAVMVVMTVAVMVTPVVVTVPRPVDLAVLMAAMPRAVEMRPVRVAVDVTVMMAVAVVAIDVLGLCDESAVHTRAAHYRRRCCLRGSTDGEESERCGR
jgi:hypothetical protein